MTIQLASRPKRPARFLYWSDLHDEFWEGFNLPDLDVQIDGVLVGGDTNTRGRHLDIPAAAARKYGCPVVVIWGNHEAYGSVWSELLEQEDVQLAQLHAEGLDVRVLHGDATEIAGVRIIAATLWTDLKLYPKRETESRMMASAFMQDYRAIKTAKSTNLTTEDMLVFHRNDKAAILKFLQAPHAGPTIVLTHHLPVRPLISQWRDVDSNPERPLNASFASDLWDDFSGLDIDVWLSGHSHENNRWIGKGDHGDVKFLMNARGYPNEGSEFDPTFIISTN